MMNNGFQEVTCHADGHEENHKVEYKFYLSNNDMI
jgi:hypothetical protein